MILESSTARAGTSIPQMAPTLAAAPKVSSYKHVSFRHGRVGKPWQAVVWKQGHAHYYGCHTTELGAAKVVAKKLGLPGPPELGQAHPAKKHSLILSLTLSAAIAMSIGM